MARKKISAWGGRSPTLKMGSKRREWENKKSRPIHEGKRRKHEMKVDAKTLQEDLERLVFTSYLALSVVFAAVSTKG